MKIAELKEEYNNKYNEELNNTGIFWAFGMQQFEENRTYQKLKLNLKDYLSIGAGGYYHKRDKEKVEKFFKETAPKLRQEFLSKVDRKEYIKYELENHETFYTGRTHEIYKLLKSDYADLTQEEIDKVYNKYKKNYNCY